MSADREHSDLIEEIERLRQQNKLLEEENHALVAAATHFPCLVAILQEETVVYINPTGAKLLDGDSPKDILGRSTLEFIPPDLKDFYRKRIQRADEGEHNLAAPITLLTLKGKTVPVLSQSGPITHQGRPAALIAATDQTEAQAARQDCKNSETMLRNLAENLDQVLFASMPETGHILFINQAYEIVFGRSVKDLYRDPADWLKSLHHEDRERIEPVATTGAPPGGTVENRYRVLRPDGEIRWVHERIKMLADDTGQPLLQVGMAEDITEQVHNREALTEAKEKAEAASQTKSEFLAKMSHELRTPLNGVLGMLQLLKLSKLDKEQEEFVTTAMQSSRRMNALIGDILDLSRVEAGKLKLRPKDFDLRQTVKGVLDVFRPQLANDVKLEVSVHAELPPMVRGDEQRLSQILTNLVGNAVKFTRKGTILVAVEPHGTPSSGLHELLFTVSDTGPGIPGDKLPTIFDPFVQATCESGLNRSGFGLGLSIVKELVRLMNGTLAIESEKDVGTKVRVTLALTSPSPPGDRRCKTSRSSTPPCDGGLRVLLVEDDALNAAATNHYLSRLGHTASLARNGLEAIELLKVQEYDLVLMDIQMPRMDGLTCAKTIRSSAELGDKSDIPIIAITAFAMKGDRERFLAGGMSGYLAKPFEMDDLEAAISRTLS